MERRLKSGGGEARNRYVTLACGVEGQSMRTFKWVRRIKYQYEAQNEDNMG